MPEPAPKKTLMRSLGEFVGHIVKGVNTDTTAPQGPAPQRTVVSHEVQEETRQTSAGKMIIRRSTIEEVEIIQPAPPRPDNAPGA
ncbi:MAG: hypothetical protein H7210_02565 [Pyrinomonadaceae bacterium]|nr:hypothetical protein [Phycisphaerales bacterium]